MNAMTNASAKVTECVPFSFPVATTIEQTVDECELGIPPEDISTEKLNEWFLII